MRDPKRIDIILRQLELAWKQSPDLRLGQLLCIVGTAHEGRQMFEINPFSYEDNWWEKDLQDWIVKVNKQ